MMRRKSRNEESDYIEGVQASALVKLLKPYFINVHFAAVTIKQSISQINLSVHLLNVYLELSYLIFVFKFQATHGDSCDII